MKEIGIEIGAHRSKAADELTGQNFDYIITVCDSARETCPVFPSNAQRIHQSFEDPPALQSSSGDETRLAIFRRVRNELHAWLREFAAERG